jgi:hypothetical protein
VNLVKLRYMHVWKYNKYMLTKIINLACRYFILLDGIVNFILISFSSCSLLGNSNTIEFCLLTLYPANLLSAFISSISLGDFLYIELFVNVVLPLLM